MSDFPRTQIENLSLPRMLIGTNWFLGYSHTSAAQDDFIKQTMGRDQIADVLEVFLNAGIDAVLGTRAESPQLEDAIRIAEDRTGRGMIKLGTPHFDPNLSDEGEVRRVVDEFAKIGTRICLPHQAVTDAMVDRKSRRIAGMDRVCRIIREAGMIPGLSTHMPETPVYADETDLDVGTYIQIYNAAGFLMQIEVDWVHRMIWNRRKPVITIKPFAAGRLHPLVGLAFGWATIRPQDMICLGTMTPDQAREVIEISWSQLQRTDPTVQLQTTRSKASVTPRA